MRRTAGGLRRRARVLRDRECDPALLHASIRTIRIGTRTRIRRAPTSCPRAFNQREATRAATCKRGTGDRRTAAPATIPVSCSPSTAPPSPHWARTTTDSPPSTCDPPTPIRNSPPSFSCWPAATTTWMAFSLLPLNRDYNNLSIPLNESANWTVCPYAGGSVHAAEPGAIQEPDRGHRPDRSDGRHRQPGQRRNRGDLRPRQRHPHGGRTDARHARTPQQNKKKCKKKRRRAAAAKKKCKKKQARESGPQRLTRAHRPRRSASARRRARQIARSWIARPVESKSVISSGARRPGALPIRTSPELGHVLPLDHPGIHTRWRARPPRSPAPTRRRRACSARSRRGRPPACRARRRRAPRGAGPAAGPTRGSPAPHPASP